MQEGLDRFFLRNVGFSKQKNGVSAYLGSFNLRCIWVWDYEMEDFNCENLPLTLKIAKLNNILWPPLFSIMLIERVSAIQSLKKS